MAALEEIRKRGVLIVFIIGIALLAFLLTDFLTSGSSFLRGTNSDVAQVWGKSVSIGEYQKRINDISEIYSFANRASMSEEMRKGLQEDIWEQMIHEKLLKDSYSNLGIDVTQTEFQEVALGESLHSLIRQQYGDVAREDLIRFLNQRDFQSVQGKHWQHFIEKPIVKQLMFSKYTTLIKQGIGYNDSQVKTTQNQNNNNVSFSYVVKPYTSLSDDEIQISQEEIKDYYNQHKERFKQKGEERNLEYVSFEIKPSEEDYEKAEEEITIVKSEYEKLTEYDEIVNYVNYTSDVPYSAINLNEDQVEDELKKFAFSSKVGDVYGPYFENDAQKIVKLSAINYLPDSVKARHVLLKPSEMYNTLEELQAFADSLKGVIEKGGAFSEIAQQYSDDGSSSQQGGELGWFSEGMMVKPFNDSCFSKKKGEIFTVQTNFGIHVVQIQDQSPKAKKVQLGTVVVEVAPTTKTMEGIYAKASVFTSKLAQKQNFDEIATELKLAKRVAYGITSQSYSILGITNARELVRWAYANNEESISPILEMDNKYIIAKLSKVKEKGYLPIDEVENQIKAELMNEKKANKFIEEISAYLKEQKSIQELAKDINTSVEHIQDANIQSSYTPVLGNELSVVAVALDTEVNELSKPIKGKFGVYVISVTSKKEIETNVTSKQIKLQQRQMYSYMIENPSFNLVVNTLKEVANVEDYRVKFY